MPEDIVYPPDEGEPGDARIPALVQQIAIGRNAEQVLGEIAQEMANSGELKDNDTLYPGVIVSISLTGKANLWLIMADLSPYLPRKSKPAEW